MDLNNGNWNKRDPSFLASVIQVCISILSNPLNLYIFLKHWLDNSTRKIDKGYYKCEVLSGILEIIQCSNYNQ